MLLALGKIVYCENIQTFPKSHKLGIFKSRMFYKKLNRNYTCISQICLILPKYTMFRQKSKTIFDSVVVTLMALSSLHAAYGPGDY